MNYTPPTDESWGFYSERKKLKNGQMCEIKIYEKVCKNQVLYPIVFAIADKKKQLKAYLDGTNGGEKICLHCTGKSLEGLIWAKNQILNFKPQKAGKIFITGEDKRRYQVYKRVLLKYGFKEEHLDFCGMALTKEI